MEHGSYTLPFDSDADHDSEPTDRHVAARISSLSKLRQYAVVHIGLAVIAMGAGTATMSVASKNFAFPAFNFGPIVSGVMFFFGGMIGWHGSGVGLQEDGRNMPSDTMKFYFQLHFWVILLCTPFSILSAMVCILTATVCFDSNEIGMPLPNGEELSFTASCEPNKLANASISLITGVICLLMLAWSIIGLCLNCLLGRTMGFTSVRPTIIRTITPRELDTSLV